MTVSFVVIAYNEERTIARTLRAILAQKDLPDFEVVVVNDGSRDRTLQEVQAVAKDHPEVRVIDQTNQGRGAARAAGVQAATGAYIAFIDADIVLPADWLSRCLSYMSDYDAVGGIAVPDGDATFVYRVCGLSPKVAAQTTAITGNNGLFKRSVFDKVSYNPTKKNGEDVALGYAMQAAGIPTKTLSDLVVDHRETKSYGKSLSWLLESGIGASRQFYEHRQIRLPDLAFIGFVALVVLGVIAPLATNLPWWFSLLVLFLYVSASSLMHLRGKFYLERTPLRSLAGLLLNDTLITSYYIGRLAGLVTERSK
jgi:glycosyltransferase involved in cell wall biosynthesis